ncbi:hypothetical protein HYX14_06065 [Candidatus Woesearchaeota archaeon]|nr:hypothetical protein [Candidatus Woesearchaeota archaeon]
MGKFWDALKSFGFKAAPAAKSAASATVSAGKVTMGTTVIKGAVAGGALAAGAEVVQALKVESFILMLLGIVHFVFLRGTGFQILTSTILLIIGTLATTAYFSDKLEKARSAWIIVLAFLVWYFMLGRTADTLPYVGGVAAAFLVIYGFGTQGKGFSALIAIVPILFFFLDVGLLAWAFQQFGWTLTPIIQTLVLFMPWWALLGFFYLPSGNVVVTIFKILGIVYLIFVLFIPTLPDIGHSGAALPGPEELLQAQKTVTAQLPQKENPAWSNLACIFGGEYTNVQACVDRRQEESGFNDLCSRVEGKKSGTVEFTECIQEQKQKKQREQLIVAGVTDPLIRAPTKAEFVIGDFFPKTSYREPNKEFKIIYPVELKIKNPRKLQFDIDLSCTFVNTKTKQKISGESMEPLKILEEEKSITIPCQPTDTLEGSYTAIYEAIFRGLTTTTRLSRAFIGTKTPEQKKTLIPEIRQSKFPGNTHLPQSPAEFARLNFAFGNPPENPIVEEGSLFLVGSIENIGPGKILAIHSYTLQLDGFETDPPACKSGANIIVPLLPSSSGKQIIYQPTCSIKKLPTDLQNPKDFEYREFTGDLEYDYQLTKEVPLEVKVIVGTS